MIYVRMVYSWSYINDQLKHLTWKQKKNIMLKIKEITLLVFITCAFICNEKEREREKVNLILN